MRILALHSNAKKDDTKWSAVDTWRIANPIRELKKHVDWEITERDTLIPSAKKMQHVTEFTPAELDKAFKEICQYDIVFGAYQSNPSLWTLLQVARDKAGVQYVMDVDDDLFAINPDNPVWMNITDDHAYYMQRMVANNPWITTTNDRLADKIRSRRPNLPANTVQVIPNFISKDYKPYTPDNGNKIVIGFFGGSAHYNDLHRTGMLEGLQKLMHENKQVYFKSVGMPVDTYLPRARVMQGDAKKGRAWTREVFPALNFDISVGPLEDNPFNIGKSDIKWQESTRMGAVLVCSNIGPYAELDDSVAIKTNNTVDDWYRALKKAVDDAALRAQLTSNANVALRLENRLEDNWAYYKRLFETVHNTSNIPEYAIV
jgi:hypothetical protein